MTAYMSIFGYSWRPGVRYMWWVMIEPLRVQRILRVRIKTGLHLSQISLKPEIKEDLGKNRAQPTVAPPTCHGSSTSFPPALSVLMRTRGCSFLLTLLASIGYGPNVALKNPKTESLSFSFQIILLTDKPPSPEIWLSPPCFRILSSTPRLAEFLLLRVVAQWGKVPWTAWCYKCPFLLSTNIY